MVNDVNINTEVETSPAMGFPKQSPFIQPHKLLPNNSSPDIFLDFINKSFFLKVTLVNVPVFPPGLSL